MMRGGKKTGANNAKYRPLSVTAPAGPGRRPRAAPRYCTVPSATELEEVSTLQYITQQSHSLLSTHL